MKRQQQLWFIVFSLLAGLIGGFISNQIFQTKSAFAEKKPKVQKVVVAEEFRLVNNKGEIRAVLKAQAGKTELRLTDGYSSNVELATSTFLGASLWLNYKGYTEVFMAAKRAAKVNLSDTLNNIGVTANAPRMGLYYGKPNVQRITLYGESFLYPNVRIGNMETVDKKTGVTHHHPVSSIILFNEKGDVLWSAP